VGIVAIVAGALISVALSVLDKETARPSEPLVTA
jgi:hypothetical protein